MDTNLINAMQDSLKKGKGGVVPFPSGGRVIKKVVSNILNQKRDWIECKDTTPSDFRPVVLRLLHPEKIIFEDQENKYPLEDVKIGRYNRETGQWTLLKPHPKYDYSPLSNQEELLEETVVTHWAEPIEGELENWLQRFDRILKYERLEVHVSPEMEEIVYRAILHAASSLSKEIGPYLFRNPTEEEAKQLHPETIKLIDEIRLYHSVLCDLQFAIDNSPVEPEETISGEAPASTTSDIKAPIQLSREELNLVLEHRKNKATINE